MRSAGISEKQSKSLYQAYQTARLQMGRAMWVELPRRLGGLYARFVGVLRSNGHRACGLKNGSGGIVQVAASNQALTAHTLTRQLGGVGGVKQLK